MDGSIAPQPCPPKPRDALARPRTWRVGRAAPLLFPLLAFLLLWEVLVGGRVLLPAVHLKEMAPWNRVVASGEPAAQGPPTDAAPQWNALQWDAMAEFYPWRLHLARSLAEGRIPLWNPYVLSGTPFLANSQSAPLYPPHLLYALPPGAEATAARMGWLAWLHLSLAGVLAFALARGLGASVPAALLGGAAFELSGFAVAWLELPSFLSVGCWIPLLLLALIRAVRESSFRWAVAAGGACGLMLLGGHLQIGFYGLLAAALFWSWETALRWRAAPPAGRARVLGSAVALGAVATTLGLALAAPQLLPAVELSRISHRTGPPSVAGWEAYRALALPPQNGIVLLVPDYYGLPARGDFWGMWSYGPPNTMEYAGHIGLAGFLLAAIGLVWGGRAAGGATLCGVLGLLLATASPVAQLLYFHMPGFAQSGSPARALVLVVLAQALLAALGAEHLLQRVREDWRRIFLPLAVGAAATAAALLGARALAHAALANLLATGRLQLDPLQLDRLLAAVSAPALVRAVAGAGALLGLALLLAWLLRENSPRHRAATLAGAFLFATAGTLLLLGRAFNPTSPLAWVYPETPLTRALAGALHRVAVLNRRWSLTEVPPALLPPNASMVYGWRDAQGYDSLYTGVYRRLADALAGDRGGWNASPPENGNMLFIRHAGSPLFPLLAARLVVGASPQPLPALRPAPDMPQNEAPVFEYSAALPEAFRLERWFTAEDAEGLRALSEAARRDPTALRRLALVAPAPDLPRLPPSGPAGTPESDRAEAPADEPLPRVLRHAPGRIDVAVPEGRGALLVLLEGFAPGWKARLRTGDAPPRPARVLRVDVAFLGVLLGPGAATVEWRYEPDSFRAGLFLALLAVAVFAATVAGRRRSEGCSDAARESGRSPA